MEYRVVMKDGKEFEFMVCQDSDIADLLNTSKNFWSMKTNSKLDYVINITEIAYIYKYD